MKKKHHHLKRYTPLFIVLFMVVTVVLIAYTFVMDFYQSTNSMIPTMLVNSVYTYNKLAYVNSKPQRGDIVVTRSPVDFNKTISQRIVALPGDNIRLHNGKVSVNNKLLEEKYLLPNTETREGKFLKENITYVVPPNYYAMLNDNRSNIFDTREWGFVPAELISGEIWFKIL